MTRHRIDVQISGQAGMLALMQQESVYVYSCTPLRFVPCKAGLAQVSTCM